MYGATFWKVLQTGHVGRHFFGAEVDDDQRAGVALLDGDVAEEFVAVGGAVDELGRTEQDGLVLPQVGLEDVDHLLNELQNSIASSRERSSAGSLGINFIFFCLHFIFCPKLFAFGGYIRFCSLVLAAAPLLPETLLPP